MALDDTLNRLHRTFFDLTVVVDTALRAESPPAIDEIWPRIEPFGRILTYLHDELRAAAPSPGGRARLAWSGAARDTAPAAHGAAETTVTRGITCAVRAEAGLRFWHLGEGRPGDAAFRAYVDRLGRTAAEAGGSVPAAAIRGFIGDNGSTTTLIRRPVQQADLPPMARLVALTALVAASIEMLAPAHPPVPAAMEA
ncbi:hypothetical protein [Tistrella mobilis]|uniref:Uncharacterized protein n=1 Tax=Tistrella mobilis (strain KA081020-065) TaxID=1110502 RepID=I3TRV9_TISMK|nr:hypothetical protein [Tistrella mobilis]AFK55497.1 hypothetical protein TMO_a0094 [Tistrella mobilis KA081020-065]